MRTATAEIWGDEGFNRSVFLLDSIEKGPSDGSLETRGRRDVRGDIDPLEEVKSNLTLGNVCNIRL
ncbi:hypothetical protein HPP92_010158 [Vanilla planifolia]|uniref:Uncharacterized protein n=1 Tax=Vanilla planifolia TaxID=51239 RepID=A0A835QTC9_VANPL|nr:hypothetical protein HPP92_010158 [Vanilla planifolia]